MKTNTEITPAIETETAIAKAPKARKQKIDPIAAGLSMRGASAFVREQVRAGAKKLPLRKIVLERWPIFVKKDKQGFELRWNAAQKLQKSHAESASFVRINSGGRITYQRNGRERHAYTKHVRIVSVK